MKIGVLAGDHPRHLYFAKQIKERYPETELLIMEREPLLSNPPEIFSTKDRIYYKKHFSERKEKEEEYFAKESLDVYEYKTTKTYTLNEDAKTTFARAKTDLLFVFGTHLLDELTLRTLPENTFNLHLGLSPRYKGSAGLFWPFYMLEPNQAGFTFHKIVKKIDAGPIVHQGTPELYLNDGIHDVACRTVIKAASESIRLLEEFQNKGCLKWKAQKKTGKLWNESDFRPEHLRIIYEHYNNQIVRMYLEGEISPKVPELTNQWTSEFTV
jgi:methionyl-tRNA formyltransferase